MWTSSRGNDDQTKAISGTPSKSSPAVIKSMEDVWKDITLISSLHYPTDAAAASNTGIILQDFLSPSFSKDSLSLPLADPIGIPDTPSAAGFGFLRSPAPQPPPSQSGGPKRLQPQSKSHACFEKPSSRSPFKRPPENDEHSDDGRFKRLIKNRESAARSRDRKHAYTSELEGELARLKKENSKLRRQIETLCFAVPAQLPKKQTLCRTLTAPF